MGNRVDRWFLRFARSSDPRDLARVFDATAPELWRVAAHLCRNRHDAEDAVQSTFLTAIEHAGTWDGGRPLLPWLLGILLNRVRTQRRVLSRAIDAARLGVRGNEPDPARHVADRELSALAAGLIERVDEPFRTVLLRSLVHGESPVEIALQLSVPAATVRTRLHRGLEQLRRKLPAGAAVGGLAPMSLQLPQSVAVAMRAKVMAAIGDAGALPLVKAGAVARRALAPAMVTTAGLVWSAVAVLATAATFVLWPGHAALPTPVAGVSRTAHDAPSAGMASTERDGDPSANGHRDLLADAPIRQLAPDLAPGVGTLHILVRNAATEQPIRGAEVYAWHEAPAASEQTQPAVIEPSAAVSATSAAPLTANATTDDGGWATLQLVAGRARIVCVHGPTARSYVDVRAGAEVEHLHEVPALFEADVRVVDERGRPVPDAAIVGVRNGGSSLVPEVLGRTGTDGHWREPCPERALRLRALVDGRVASAEAMIGAAPLPATVELRLGGGAVPAHGSVLDADGRAVASARVVFVAAGRVDSLLAVRSADDGRFRCAHLAAGRYHVAALEPSAGSNRRRGRCRLTVVDLVATNAAPIELRLPQGASVSVQMARHDGTTVGVGSISVTPNFDELPQALLGELGRGVPSDGDGLAVLEGLMPGRYRLTMNALQQVHEQDIELRDGERLALQHAFGRVEQLGVELVDEDGRPRAGLQVALRLGAKGTIAQATDGDGRASFPAVAAGEHTVEVSARGRSGVVWSRHVVATGRPNRLLVESILGTSTVRGRLVTTDGTLSAELSVTVHRLDAHAPLQRESEQAKFDPATGEFLVDGLPPGRFAMFAHDRALGVAVAHRGPFAVPSGDLDLGEIAIGGAELIVAMRAPIAVEAPVGSVAYDGVFGPSSWQVRGDALHSPMLAAGAYSVLVWGKNVQPAFTTATVSIGAAAHAAVDLVAGTATTLRLPQDYGMLEFALADGTALRQVHVGGVDFVRGFATGRHRVVFTAFDGGRAAAEFVVGEVPGAPVVLASKPDGR